MPAFNFSYYNLYFLFFIIYYFFFYDKKILFRKIFSDLIFLLLIYDLLYIKNLRVKYIKNLEEVNFCEKLLNIFKQR
jgi:hypothetical protein